MYQVTLRATETVISERLLKQDYGAPPSSDQIESNPTLELSRP